MQKHTVNEYIGKPIITLTGDILGAVENVVFTKKLNKLKYLKSFDESGEGIPFFVDVKHIMTAGENAIILKTSYHVLEDADGCLPLRQPVFTTDGKELGIAKDITLDDAFGADLLVLDGGEDLPAAKALVVGNSAIIVNLSDEIIKAPKKKREKPETVQREIREEAAAAQTGPQLPDMVIANNKLLLGRKVQKDIYNQFGEVIIPQGKIITTTTLEIAKKYGKLFELTINSLSNLY